MTIPTALTTGTAPARHRGAAVPTAPLPASVCKVGNVTRQPELAYSPKGTAYVRFGLAVTPYRRRGELPADTSFYEVVAFGSLAENLAECVEKGARLVVSGRPEVEQVEAKDDPGPRTVKKIVADAIGPDLRFATVQITRREATAPPVAPPPDDEEEPF